MLDYEAADESELSLEQGDVVQVLGISEGDRAWWIGRLHGQLGRFPAVMVDPQPVSGAGGGGVEELELADHDATGN